MLGVFAQFEAALRKERQMEGLAKAKSAGVYKGRKPSVEVGWVPSSFSDALRKLADEVEKREESERTTKLLEAAREADRP